MMTVAQGDGALERRINDRPAHSSRQRDARRLVKEAAHAAPVHSRAVAPLSHDPSRSAPLHPAAVHPLLVRRLLPLRDVELREARPEDRGDEPGRDGAALRDDVAPGGGRGLSSLRRGRERERKGERERGEQRGKVSTAAQRAASSTGGVLHQAQRSRTSTCALATSRTSEKARTPEEALPSSQPCAVHTEAEQRQS